jgi:G3E family GTPase
VRTPLTIVTGFLGAGKTTLLQRLLADPDVADAAVLVNEIGDIALDHHLLRRVDERTVVLASGCVCCTIRGDLADELRALKARRLRGEIPSFRRVVLETSGLADPAPVLSTLLADLMLAANYAADGVVTCVDAVGALPQADRAPEWIRQVALADRLVLTKADLATDEDLAAVRLRLRAANPAAPIIAADHGAIAAASILGAAPTDPAERLADTLRWLDAVGAGTERHAHDVEAHAIRLEQPLDWTMFGIWLSMLVARYPTDVLRVKGLLDVGDTGPLLVNGVQHVIHPPLHLPQWPDDDHASRIVVIARGISRVALLRSLVAFEATSGHILAR